MKLQKRTVLQTMSEWQKQLNNARLSKFLGTGLKTVIIPSLIPGFDPNQYSRKGFEQYLAKLPLNRLRPKQLMLILDDGFNALIAAGKIKKRTKDNYRSAVKQFVEWMGQQVWYRELFPHPAPAKAPQKVSLPNKVPQRTRQDIEYGLPLSDFPSSLCCQVEAIGAFWLRSSEKRLPSLEQTLTDDSMLSLKAQRERRAQRSRDAAVSGYSFERPHVIKIGASTWERYVKIMCCFFGWCITNGYAVEELCLDLFTDPIFLQDFSEWLCQERGCSFSESVKLLQAAISVAKAQSYHESRRRDWSDIERVKQLQEMRAHYSTLYQQQKPQLDEARWENKSISHQQAREVVQYLFERTGLRTYGGSRRDDSTLFFAWQTYLIVKILTYAPVRQEELRKLQWGTTLIKVTDSSGNERYAVRIKNHKTFSKTGKARYYPLPNILTRDLDVWLEQIRPSALKATQTLENWLKFWGHSPKELERLEQKLLNLQLSGILPQQCSSPQRYKQNLERKYEGLKSRIAAWEVAKANAEVCHNVFFSLGGSHPGSFGKAYDESRTSCISSMVSRAVGRATKALYGQAYYLNPHGFRHIGSKQVRMAGKDKAAFSALVGHTLRVDDQYAAQVTQDYELIVDFVDDWWDKSSM